MRILVIQTAFPGDAILTLPLIQELRSQNEKSIVDVLCIPSTKILFEASPVVNSVIVFDKKGNDKKFGRFLKLAQKLRSNKYDIVYSPHRSARSAILSKLTNAAQRISFDKSSLNILYTKLVPYRGDWHEVKRNLSLITDSEVKEWNILPKLNLSHEVKKFAANILNEIGTDKFIIIAPGSVWLTKKFPEEYFKIIAEKLAEKGYKILLIGGKEDRKLAERIVSDEKVMINLCGKVNFLHSVYLMQKSKLVICNDSAPTHLAMCADAKVLTIYCSTVPGFGFYPYNSRGSYISYDQLKCKPCGIHGFNKCPESHFKCGFELEPESVLQKIYEIL